MTLFYIYYLIMSLIQNQTNMYTHQNPANYFFGILECLDRDNNYIYRLFSTDKTIESYLDDYNMDGYEFTNIRLLILFNRRQSSQTTIHQLKQYVKNNTYGHIEDSLFERIDTLYDCILNHPRMNIDFNEVELSYNIERNYDYDEDYLSDYDSEDNDPTWEP